MKSQRERDNEKREQKLREIDDAVASGDLVIRQMTDEERKKLPPKPPRQPRRRT
jgi:hypothetical protein